jgi:hypothetical protein
VKKRPEGASLSTTASPRVVGIDEGLDPAAGLGDATDVGFDVAGRENDEYGRFLDQHYWSTRRAPARGGALVFHVWPLRIDPNPPRSGNRPRTRAGAGP